ncbi:DUF3139 domain-containing protein [Bacillus sp. FJAT-49705]|uniref:DUF3139 domain-containing protein n=1 Tax=Cytobacillus citreus TaxID=2833586 RepID=A0ABS5NQU3_9BACI|nr:DUF3139 domain-containing protein [Cytobacillus citreus]
MSRRKINGFIILILFIFMVGSIIWYINFPYYEKVAEKRINTYMEAQNVDKKKILDKDSHLDFKTGRWEINYKFKDEPNLTYEYTFDRKTNQVLLLVFNSTKLIGGSSVESGMNYPSIHEGWSKFDEDGNLID